LFRKFKDPTILSSQFAPLFERLRFLIFSDEGTDATTIKNRVDELVTFVRSLSMGQFYGDRIASLLKMPMAFGVLSLDLPEAAYKRRRTEHNAECLDVLKAKLGEVLALAVELLRYQPWSKAR
jgi:hypothetical protein